MSSFEHLEINIIIFRNWEQQWFFEAPRNYNRVCTMSIPYVSKSKLEADLQGIDAKIN